MKKVHNLNGHSVKEVAEAVMEFFRAEYSGMNIEIFAESNGYRIMAEDCKKDLIVKAAGGDTRCEVILIPLDQDKIEITTGNGAWGGKILTAGVFGATCILFPFGMPAMAAYVIGGSMFYAGAKTIKQIKLPALIDDYIYHYLYDNQSQ